MLSTYYTYSKNNNGGFMLFTPEVNFPRQIEGAPRLSNVNAEAWTFAPHAATAMVLTHLWGDSRWVFRSKMEGTKKAQVYGDAAAVRTVCSPKIIVLGRNVTSFAVPNLRAHEVWFPNDTRANNYVNITATAEEQQQMRTANMTTVFLGSDSGLPSLTTGVLVLGSENRTYKRLAMVCSIDARWNRALHSVDDANDNSIGSTGRVVSVELCGRRSQSDLKNATLLEEDDCWRHITMDGESLEAGLGFETVFSLSYQPHAIDQESHPIYTSALGSMLLARLQHLTGITSLPGYWTDNVDAVESVISTVFADSLSRIGIERQQVAGYLPAEGIDSCRRITSGYSLCPPPLATERDNWTPLDYVATNTGMEPLLLSGLSETDPLVKASPTRLPRPPTSLRSVFCPSMSSSLSSMSSSQYGAGQTSRVGHPSKTC